jgi:hypothetical protein
MFPDLRAAKCSEDEHFTPLCFGWIDSKALKRDAESRRAGNPALARRVRPRVGP